MSTPDVDQRSPARRAADEQIAAEPQKGPPDLPDNAQRLPLEAYLAHQRRPVAMTGVVENGVVRLLDPTVKLTEHARVIVVASE